LAPAGRAAERRALLEERAKAMVVGGVGDGSDWVWRSEGKLGARRTRGARCRQIGPRVQGLSGGGGRGRGGPGGPAVEDLGFQETLRSTIGALVLELAARRTLGGGRSTTEGDPPAEDPSPAPPPPRRDISDVLAAAVFDGTCGAQPSWAKVDLGSTTAHQVCPPVRAGTSATWRRQCSTRLVYWAPQARGAHLAPHAARKQPPPGHGTCKGVLLARSTNWSVYSYHCEPGRVAGLGNTAPAGARVVFALPPPPGSPERF
jgi:hypothetical protein